MVKLPVVEKDSDKWIAESRDFLAHLHAYTQRCGGLRKISFQQRKVVCGVGR